MYENREGRGHLPPSADAHARIIKICQLQICRWMCLQRCSGVAKGGKWGHAPWGAGHGSASTGHLLSFKYPSRAYVSTKVYLKMRIF